MVWQDGLGEVRLGLAWHGRNGTARTGAVRLGLAGLETTIKIKGAKNGI